MRRPAIPYVFVSLALPCVAAWWGCASGASDTTSADEAASSSVASTATSSSGGDGGHGGAGGGGGAGGAADGGGGACVSTTAEAHRVPLDLIFLIDRSTSMSGPKWVGTSAALKKFFNDPASAGIGVGLEFLPTDTASDCDVSHYELLVVPIGPLPDNSFALSNALPADANVYGTPMYGALKGALYAATAYQDAHPSHKVSVVLATDGDPFGCVGQASDVGVHGVSGLAKSALDYNGVRTYVIGVEGATIANLNTIAAAGGTGAAYDVTIDITQFSAKIGEIRSQAVGCDFEIPAPPHGETLDPSLVNFTYAPGGMGTPQYLPRNDNLAACSDQPGWYYDNPSSPSRIILCPASCTTVSNDPDAKVDVLFGCSSIIH